MKNWKSRVFVYSNLDSAQALDCLISNKSLVVIPSLTDNLPNTVLECIENSLPFVTSNSGGQSELIETSLHSDFVFEPHPSQLSSRIKNWFAESNSFKPAQYNFNPKEVIEWWDKLFCSHYDLPARNESYSEIVSIGVVHFNQFNLLIQTLEGISNQTYKKIQIILCDDGSTEAKAVSFLNKLEEDRHYKGIPLKLLRKQKSLPRCG